MSRFPWIEASRLWLVLDRTAAAPRSLSEVAELCIAGGVDVVVFRMKDATVQEALPIAREVRALCKYRNTRFVLSHFLELAAALSPDAIHLGSADPPVAEVRSQLRPEIAIGYSAHSVDEAEQAAQAGADYVFLGPVLATPSKLGYGTPLGLSVVQDSMRLDVPTIFIGGMDAATIPRVVAAGGKRVAAIRALQAVADPCIAAAELRALLPD